MNNNNNKLTRSESYKIANNQFVLSSSPSYPPKISNVEKHKLDIEDRIEKEIEAELWRERINYPASVSPKTCQRRRCHVYGSADHARELLSATSKRRTVVLPPLSVVDGRARVLSISVADTEIWWDFIQNKSDTLTMSIPTWLDSSWNIRISSRPRRWNERWWLVGRDFAVRNLSRGFFFFYLILR